MCGQMMCLVTRGLLLEFAMARKQVSGSVMRLACGLAGLLELPVLLLHGLVNVEFQACIWYYPQKSWPNASAERPTPSIPKEPMNESLRLDRSSSFGSLTGRSEEDTSDFGT